MAAQNRDRLEKAFGRGIQPVESACLLTDEINNRTRGVHNKLHAIPNLKLVFALCDHAVYREYLRTFYWVYKTLDDELDKASDGRINAITKLFHKPRSAAILQDLQFWFGGPSSQSIVRSPRGKLEREVVRHIHTIAKEEPLALIAWCHVMYLALFAGGVVVRSTITHSLGFMRKSEDGNGAELYNLKDPESLRTSLRRQINEAGTSMTDAQRTRVLDESVATFVWTTRLIEGLSLQQTSGVYMWTKRIVGMVTAFLAIFLLRRIVWWCL